jgi:hypothetical protein
MDLTFQFVVAGARSLEVNSLPFYPHLRLPIPWSEEDEAAVDDQVAQDDRDDRGADVWEYVWVDIQVTTDHVTVRFRHARVPNMEVD